jgi:hypothetical protein
MTGRRSEPPDTGCRRSTGTAVTWVSQSDAQNQEHAVTKRLTLSVTVALVAIRWHRHPKRMLLSG